MEDLTFPMEEALVGDLTIIRAPSGHLTGSRQGVPEHERFEARLFELRHHPTDTLVNLERVQHLNSTFLGALVSAHAACRRRNIKMWLCGIDARIDNVFVIAKLSIIFEVYPTEAAAIVAYRASQPVA